MRYTDPFDDGGTPGWRARTIEHNESEWQRWYKKASPIDVLIFSTVASLLLGVVVFVGGLVAIVLWSLI